MEKQKRSFTINLGLVISGFITIFSGLLIQVKYHIGNHENGTEYKQVFNIGYSGWTNIHKLAIIALLVLIIFHIYLHWKWFKTVITKRLIKKNSQTITLSVIFGMVAITGLVPWVINLLEGNQSIRNTFIEIHDKLAIILAVHLIIHIIHRLKWFLTTYKKLQNNLNP